MEDISALNGKVALVTGATSGLGRASALALAAAGAKLFLVGRNADGLAETAKLLPGKDVATHVADLTDPAACSAIVPAAVDHFGQLDALCNVAGIIFVANSPDMPINQWDRIIATNLTAPFLLSRAAIPHLLKTGGAIINIASAAAFTGQAYGAAYSASKAGLVGMTKSMAMEFAKQPIRINAIAPGGMMTNVAKNFRPPEGCDFDLMKRFTGPRGGMVEVSDVADLVVYLASDAGRGFHGACLNIDAGVTAG
ncbi:SDR family oxidoreductase [Sphingobium sufflavum]|uniref:SDR family NAD(P)-dependent oxidoreductase n=1 Tax=Sphingobium sufflavum TaxID=1129547 RepID=UPI001F44BFC7|nr:SDR family oxidoreductase [Sphingobium sufflavum]MCE7798069.1 SDR family oxidoreductase [Sphingobium sufflavum]